MAPPTKKTQTKSTLYPQAFLMDTLTKGLKGSRGNSSGPPVITKSSFGASPLQKTVPIAKISGVYQPSTVVNKIHGTGETYKLHRNFLNIENHKLSLLVPELRLYAIVKGKYRPFYFPVTTDYKFNSDGTFDASQPYSSNAAVIESFNVSYTAVDHFQAAVGPLRADLTIVVDSLSVVFDAPDGYSQLADLFMIRTPSAAKISGAPTRTSGGALHNGQSIGIAASLRYVGPNTSDVISQAEMSAIDDTKQVMELYYEKHNITVNANGSATITVQYNGNIAAAKDNSIWDVAKPLEEKSQMVANRAKTQSSGNAVVEISKTKAQNSASKNASNAKLETYSYLNDFIPSIAEMFQLLFYAKPTKVHNVIYSPNAIQEFFSFSQAQSKLNARSRTNSPVKTQARAKKFKYFADPDQRSPNDIWAHRYVNYINFGDLIDAWISYATEKTLTKLNKAINAANANGELTKQDKDAQIKHLQESKERISSLNILFSNIEVRPTSNVMVPDANKVSYFMNIADIPVSLDVFSRLMHERYVKPNKKRVAFSEFIEKDALQILTMCLELSGAQIIENVKIQTTSLMGKDLKNKISAGTVDVGKIKLKPDLKKTSENSTYMLFYQSNTAHVTSAGSGNATQDFQNEIIHLRPSQDRGLIKSISFSQQEISGRAETNMAAKGAAFEELRIPQNASVQLYGNNIFVPGMIVYIDPRSLGLGDPRLADSAGIKIGIGGYYEVVKVSSSYSAGVWTTSIDLHFNNYPEGDVQPRMTDEQKRASAEAFKMRNVVRKNLVTPRSGK